jgi:hypothetical protein
MVCLVRKSTLQQSQEATLAGVGNSCKVVLLDGFGEVSVSENLLVALEKGMCWHNTRLN